MFASGSAWFCLVVGLALLAEAALIPVLRRRRDSGRLGARTGQRPMLVSMGVMLLSESVPRLAGLSGAWTTTAFLVGLAGAVTTLVLATRSLDAQCRTAPPRETGPGSP
jgi:hypothetical protein